MDPQTNYYQNRKLKIEQNFIVQNFRKDQWFITITQ